MAITTRRHFTLIELLEIINIVGKVYHMTAMRICQ